MKHKVITIGCEYGAGGPEIGKRIAQALGIEFYDRDLVDKVVEQIGVDRDLVKKADAGSNVLYSFETQYGPRYANLTNRVIYNQFEVIQKFAEKSSCVIIGRSADYILKDSKDIKLLRAFIYAPDEIRIQNIMKSHSLSESDAKILLLEKDKRYHKRHLALTGSNRGDRHNRDILINSAFLDVEGTAEYLEELIQKKYGSGEE